MSLPSAVYKGIKILSLIFSSIKWEGPPITSKVAVKMRECVRRLEKVITVIGNSY